jgi:hypothetical protein
VDNGLRFFEQMPGPGEPPLNVPILEAKGRVNAPPEAVFKLLMDLGRPRREWDITFANGCDQLAASPIPCLHVCGTPVWPPTRTASALSLVCLLARAAA